MVAVFSTGLPVWCLCRYGLDHGLPGQHLLQCQVAVDRRQAGLMGQHHARGNRLLAVTAELGPVMRNGQVNIQAPGLHQPIDTGCRGTLGRGKNQYHRVLRPGATSRGVGNATPDIHHAATAMIERTGCPYLTILYEIICKCLDYRLKTGRYITSDPHIARVQIY